MKLVIQVSDDEPGAVTTHRAGAERAALGVADGRAQMEIMDGGPVPEVLLSMESEVAAGLRAAPRAP